MRNVWNGCGQVCVGCFGSGVFLGISVVQVLCFVRNGSALAGVESIISDICHLVTPGQGADSRK